MAKTILSLCVLLQDLTLVFKPEVQTQMLKCFPVSKQLTMVTTDAFLK